MLAWRLFALFLCAAFPLVPYSPDPGRHHQHQRVKTGHTCSHNGQAKLRARIGGRNHQNLSGLTDFRCVRVVLTSVEEELNEVLLIQLSNAVVDPGTNVSRRR